jgi:hypothetical protein
VDRPVGVRDRRNRTAGRCKNEREQSDEKRGLGTAEAAAHRDLLVAVSSDGPAGAASAQYRPGLELVSASGADGERREAAEVERVRHLEVAPGQGLEERHARTDREIAGKVG